MLIEREAGRTLRFTVMTVLFIILAGLIMTSNPVLSIADTLVQGVLQHNNKVGTGVYTLMSMTSKVFSPKLDLIWTVVIAFLLWGFKYKIPALWAIATIVGADALGFLAKLLVSRARPVGTHLKGDDGFSFPSGHVLGAMIVFALLFIFVVPMIDNLLIRMVLQALLIVIFIVLAVSRVYLNAHYPSDTIGSMLLAYAWLQVAEWLYIKYAPRIKQWSFVSNSHI